MKSMYMFLYVYFLRWSIEGGLGSHFLKFDEYAYLKFWFM